MDDGPDHDGSYMTKEFPQLSRWAFIGEKQGRHFSNTTIDELFLARYQECGIINM